MADRYGLAAVLRVSAGRVKRMHEDGLIPAYRVGSNQLRFDIDECLARLREDRAKESS